MKKRRLKRWVVNSLLIINILSLLFMASDCEDTVMFLISHLVALVLFALTTMILLTNDL